MGIGEKGNVLSEEISLRSGNLMLVKYSNTNFLRFTCILFSLKNNAVPT
jgi:hypothetical protein